MFTIFCISVLARESETQLDASMSALFSNHRKWLWWEAWRIVLNINWLIFFTQQYYWISSSSNIFRNLKLSHCKNIYTLILYFVSEKNLSFFGVKCSLTLYKWIEQEFVWTILKKVKKLHLSTSLILVVIRQEKSEGVVY